MKRQARGFTLLETLIVLAITGLILLLLGQAIATGALASRIDGGPDRGANSEMVESALRRMIERMDPGVWPEPASVRGSASALAFTTELPDPSTGGSITADVRLEITGGTLLLRWVPRDRGIPFVPPPVNTVRLLDHVARLDLAYAPAGAGAAWRDRWSEKTLPALVRIRIIPESGAPWSPIIARTFREQAEQ